MSVFPEILLQELNQNHELNIEDFLLAQSKEPCTSIRLNTNKLAKFNNAIEQVPWCKNAYYLDKRPVFALDPLWHSGAYYVQEASSMLLYQAFKQCLDSTQSLKVLDLCAAPGGKSTLVASLLNPQSLLIANEVIQSRASILAENLMKWGQPNTWVTQNDPKQFSNVPNFFDAILIDAPCSGSGLFRKDRAYVDEWNQGLVDTCSLRQKRILHDTLTALKPGGVLIYMTCSFSKVENEEISEYILQHFDMDYLPLELNAEWGVQHLDSRGYRCYPHLLEGEGFYLACFKKHGEYFETEQNDCSISKATVVSMEHKKLIQAHIDFVDMEFIQEKENIFVLNKKHISNYYYLKNELKLIRKGTFVGQIIKDKLIPEHDLALSIHNISNNRIELTEIQALAYLRKEVFELTDVTLGWWLCTFNQIPLGWIKVIGNRFNNYLPLHLRLRMK
jgi:16S rRNA C967 or C1407 C5-methylase (RsmB/RsmF family)/NOL1/NOP2/fmu family ribosome biogenesis protein